MPAASVRNTPRSALNAPKSHMSIDAGGTKVVLEWAPWCRLAERRRRPNTAADVVSQTIAERQKGGDARKRASTTIDCEADAAQRRAPASGGSRRRACERSS